MIYRILILAICIFALSIFAAGQDKIGTAGPQFLGMSPSVRANGMGEAGVALVDDYSFYFNPASLGFLHPEGRRALTFYPMQTDLAAIFLFRYASFSSRVVSGSLSKQRPFTLNAAYFTSRLKGPAIPITTYDNPAGTGEYFNPTALAHNMSLGFGVSDFLDVAMGINFKIIRMDYGDIGATGTAFDLGLLINAPAQRFVAAPAHDGETRLYFAPAFGFAYCNMGHDLEMESYDYPLPEFKRVGIAAPFGVEKMIDGRNTMLALFTPSVELRNISEWDDHINYGAELEFMEAFAGRLGRYHIYRHMRYDTWGFGLKSRGMMRLVTGLFYNRSADSYGGVTKFLRDRLEIEFSFARERIRHTDVKYDYYGVTISL